jgi:hypothetical protein
MKQLLKNKIVLSRPTITQSDNMGINSVFAPVYTDLGASVQPANSSLQFQYAQRQINITHTIYVPVGVVVRNGDTISDGKYTYQVKGWRDLAGRGKVLAIDAEIFV